MIGHLLRDEFAVFNLVSFRHFLFLETAVLYKFCVKSAIAGMVDFLKEYAIHRR